MIDGLTVTVPGTEVRELCLKSAEHHRERAQAYAGQLASMEKNEIEGSMHYSGADPKRSLKGKLEEHESEAAELDFIAKHLVLTEQYLLDSLALSRLGIARKGRW